MAQLPHQRDSSLTPFLFQASDNNGINSVSIENTSMRTSHQYPRVDEENHTYLQYGRHHHHHHPHITPNTDVTLPLSPIYDETEREYESSDDFTHHDDKSNSNQLKTQNSVDGGPSP